MFCSKACINHYMSTILLRAWSPSRPSSRHIPPSLPSSSRYIMSSSLPPLLIFPHPSLLSFSLPLFLPHWCPFSPHRSSDFLETARDTKWLVNHNLIIILVQIYFDCGSLPFLKFWCGQKMYVPS